MTVMFAPFDPRGLSGGADLFSPMIACVNGHHPAPGGAEFQQRSLVIISAP
jgi:hypothetical protein